MKKIMGLSLVMLSMFTVVGCSNDNAESKFVESGFLIGSESGELTPWLSTAVKAASKQEEKVKASVYAGYGAGFIDKWNSFVTNPGYGKFALQRCIRNRAGMDISYSYLDLPDFYDESKYLVTYQEGNDGLSRNFTFKFEDSFLLDEITIEQGYVCYVICLIDDDNQEIQGNLFGGVSVGSLYFIKSDNQITFSKYASIFTE